jgi:hypothetical protein
MHSIVRRFLYWVAFGVVICTTPIANAGLFRAYLSADGNDANPCTVAQPCRLLPAALTAINDGGEIWIMDSANYNTGPVTIDKSATILAIPGAVGSVVSTGGGDAIIVNASASAKVRLRNLVIVPFGNPRSGISFVGGAYLAVDHCTITGALDVGLLIDGPTEAKVLVKDTQISGATTGIFIGGFAIDLTVLGSTVDDVRDGIFSYADINFAMERSQLIGRWPMYNGYGIAFAGNRQIEFTSASAHIARSVIRGFYVGVKSISGEVAVPGAKVSIADSELMHNAIAVHAESDPGGAAAISLTGNRLTHNQQATGYLGLAGFPRTAFVYTSGTNYFAYNESDGPPLTGPAGLK